MWRLIAVPPVDKDGTRPSLACVPSCASTVGDDVCGATSAKDKPDDARDSRLLEASQGLHFWRSIRRVVCLPTNIRAPGLLSRLPAQMRAGRIRDEMWNVYMSRVRVPNDMRLSSPSSPFANHDIRFIVHRHRIRSMRSFENARAV